MSIFSYMIRVYMSANQGLSMGSPGHTHTNRIHTNTCTDEQSWGVSLNSCALNAFASISNAERRDYPLILTYEKKPWKSWGRAWNPKAAGLHVLLKVSLFSQAALNTESSYSESFKHNCLKNKWRGFARTRKRMELWVCASRCHC